MSAGGRLTKVFNEAKEVRFNNSDKFILFSDCHRGDNTWADEFTDNQNLFLYALQHYYNKDFTYIEVGDGDELWENTFEDVRQAHHQVFRQMQDFHEKQRLYLIWGNHDMERRGKKTVKKTLYGYKDERTKINKPLVEGIEVYEGLILRHSETDRKIFVVHGHQPDLANYGFFFPVPNLNFFRAPSRKYGFHNRMTRVFIPLWRLNRLFHWYFWKYVQFFGVKDPASPAKNFSRTKKIDEELKRWAETKNQILIAGHTHSYSLMDSPYFNIGSCVFPNCITGIEIENGQIRLIEWSVKINVRDRTLKEGTLYADRDVISESYPI